MSKSLIQYILRWELSTPVLAVIMSMFSNQYGFIMSAILANFIGALLFYHVDGWIFKRKMERLVKKDEKSVL